MPYLGYSERAVPSKQAFDISNSKWVYVADSESTIQTSDVV